MELLKNLEGMSADEQMTAVVELQKAAMKQLEEQKQVSIGKSAEMVIQGLKKIKSDFEAKFDSLNYDIQAKVANLKDGEQGIQGPKGDQGDRGLDGANGRDGRDGKDGRDGLDGVDGVGVRDAKIDFDGSLVISLSTGREINVGEVVATDLAERIKVISTMSTNTAIADITGGTIDNTVIGGTTPAAGTFTDLSVTTATGESSFNENDTITAWLYSGNSFSIGAQETAPNGLFFKPDGTKMYLNGSTGDDVNEYTLGTAWNITTATFVTTFSTAAQDTGPADIFFKPDGLTMFVLGGTNDTVYQYTLGTAWDVSSASYASKSFSVTTQESSPQGLWFKPDGLVMYVVGTTSDTVFQYTLGTAWDVSTAAYASISYVISAQETNATQVNLSADGTKMWIVGTSGDDIWEYSLGTAWDVSTANPINNFYIGFQETGPTGLFVDSTAQNRVYVTGSSTDTIFQYNTENNSVKLDTEKLYIDGALSANGNFVAGSNAYVDGALTVQGAVSSSGTGTFAGLTATGTINIASSTTSTVSIAGSQTTGATIIGGTSQTGSITVGQSTVSQTLALANGATTSGNTKTVNIGTAGLSGSTTNINIGSAVSGSLGTTTIQAPTVNIGQTATQLQVTNTASAVNYFSITGAVTTGSPVFASVGSDTNINNVYVTKGTGEHRFATNASGSNTQLRVSHTASAVNYVQVTGAATGSATGLAVSAQGSDSNINLNVNPKGTGYVQFDSGKANYIVLRGAAAGSRPEFGAVGSDTNIDLTLTPKGTGNVRFGTYTANMALTVQGYIEIKDSGGTVRKLAVIA